MRTVLALALVPVMFGKDSEQGSWRAAIAVKAGWKLEVTRTDRSKVKGELERVSDESVFVKTNAGPVSVPRSEVRKIRAKPPGRAKYIALGAGIGAGAGAGILGGVAAAGQRKDADENLVPQFAVFGAAVGILLGTVLGAVSGGYRTVYEANRK